MPLLDPSTGVARTRSIMVVDDEIATCESLRDLFEHEGFTVWTAHNGLDALTVLREVPVKPCIVILDLIMPVVDGNSVYRMMKRDPYLADIPVVISTSDPARAPDGLPILRKPIAIEVLLKLVRRCC